MLNNNYHQIHIESMEAIHAFIEDKNQRTYPEPEELKHDTQQSTDTKA